MERRRFTQEFKLEAVRLIRDRGVSYAQASEDAAVAVCVLPGTELAFAHEVERLPTRLWPWHDGAIKQMIASKQTNC